MSDRIEIIKNDLALLPIEIRNEVLNKIIVFDNNISEEVKVEMVLNHLINDAKGRKLIEELIYFELVKLGKMPEIKGRR